MRRLLSTTVLLTAGVLALLFAPAASAYMNCSYTVTVYASGGQTCEQRCDFYDNETNQYQGSITREWAC